MHLEDKSVDYLQRQNGLYATCEQHPPVFRYLLETMLKS